MPDSDPVLSTTEAARLAQVSTETIRQWAKDRRVRHVRLPSGHLRFQRSDILALLEPVEPEGEAS